MKFNKQELTDKAEEFIRAFYDDLPFYLTKVDEEGQRVEFLADGYHSYLHFKADGYTLWGNLPS